MNGVARQPVTEERKRIFLEVLARTGSMSAAAHAATPWSKSEKGGLQSFKHLMRRDLEFGRLVEEARSAALGRVEEEIARRGVEGVERPIYQRGVLVGHEMVYSDRLLLRLAQRLDPDGWAERSRVEHSGRVEHSAVVLAITADDVLALDESDQAALVALLQRVAERKELGPEVPAVPA